MSVHYEFPCIEHIDDILPHIDDKSFKVIAKDCGNTYINYVRMGPETFPPVMGNESDRWTARVRRECRGIAFNTETGELVSRPFHKFFNVGENEHVTLEHFGFHRPHVVMDKLDGSMVRPIPTPYGVRWGTKMGITDTSNLAELYIFNKVPLRKLALDCFKMGVTPIFEFVSPQNRIVAAYSEPRMVLLAMRDNLTGHYWSYPAMQLFAEDYNVRCAGIYDPVEGDPALYFEAINKSNDLDEGVVVAFDNGHRCKAKTETYVILHKVKDKASTERNLILAVLDQDIDDLLPLVPEEEVKAINEFVVDFWAFIDSMTFALEVTYKLARNAYDTKKDFALASQDWNRMERAAVFTLWDGKADNARELVLTIIRTALTTETKWAQFREDLGSRLDIGFDWNKEDVE